MPLASRRLHFQAKSSSEIARRSNAPATRGWPVNSRDQVRELALRLECLSRVDAESSPLRGQCQALGRVGAARVRISFLNGGRARPRTLSRKGGSSRCARRVGGRRSPSGDHRGCAADPRARRGLLGVRAVRSGCDAPRAPHAPAAAVASWWRWSLSKLCVAVISRHSERAAERPRRWKRSQRRLNFVSAKIGSIMPLRLA